MADKFDFKKLARKKTDTSKNAAKPKKRVVYQEVEEAPIEATRQVEAVKEPEATNQPVAETTKSAEATVSSAASITTTSQISQEEAVPAANKSPKSSKMKSQKVGRKSWKEEGVTYTRMAFDTPDTTKQKIKQLLAGKFYDKCISQDEMINIALKDFIKKHYKA